MTTAKIDVAVVGATGLIGDSIVSLLEEREFPVGQLFLLASDRSIEKSLFYGGKWQHVNVADEFDFARVQLVFLAVPMEAAKSYRERALKANCWVIDVSAGVSPDWRFLNLVTRELADTRLLHLPHALSTQLATVIKPLQEAFSVQSVSITALMAASSMGRAAVEELAKQTALVLNVKPIKSKKFSKQLVFNLHPQSSVIEDDGMTLDEQRVAYELSAYLGIDSRDVAANIGLAPVFLGHSVWFELQLGRDVALTELRSTLRASSQIALLEGKKPGAFPSAVSEAAGKDLIFVGRLRQITSDPRRFSGFFACDNTRIGGALTAIQTAETLIKHQFS